MMFSGDRGANPVENAGLGFRGDIEGLRALAVLAVLGFHFKWGPLFQGGFVGVDVFFVISGFLITRNLINDNQAGQFSFGRFYSRRIRRLFPALFVTVAASLLAGALISAPEAFSQLAKSAIASVFSLANVYFYSTAGYFDSDALQKPLLHVWSLSVEEQFYLIWPAFLYLVFKLGRTKSLLALFLAVVVVGTVLAQFRLAHDPDAAFYLTWYRAGEFALGAACAVAPSGRLLPAGIREIISLSGFLLTGYAITQFAEATQFPGVSSLTPALGAALIIYADGAATNKILSTSAARYIGKISYSLYLVHWPIVSFYAQMHGEELGTVAKLALGILTFIGAVVLYHFVEQRFRYSTRTQASSSFRRFAFSWGSLAAGVCLLSAAVVIGGGWSWRLSEPETRVADQIAPEREARFATHKQFCTQTGCNAPARPGSVFIIGDSHAIDAFNALIHVRPDYNFVLLNAPGCPPLVREDYGRVAASPHRDRCIAENEKRLYTDTLGNARLIVINVLFGWYNPDHLERAIRRIHELTDAPVIVLGNYLVFSSDFPSLVLKHPDTRWDAAYAKALATDTFAFEDELQRRAIRADFRFLSKRDLLCHGAEPDSCPLEFSGKLFTYDKHHLSLAAARALGDALGQKMDAFPVALTTSQDNLSRSQKSASSPAASGAEDRPGNDLLQLEPMAVSRCTNNNMVSVRWNLATLGPGRKSAIKVVRPGREPKVFAVVQRAGSTMTGPWMRAGDKVLLVAIPDDTLLASITLGGIPCSGPPPAIASP